MVYKTNKSREAEDKRKGFSFTILSLYRGGVFIDQRMTELLLWINRIIIYFYVKLFHSILKKLLCFRKLSLLFIRNVSLSPPYLLPQDLNNLTKKPRAPVSSPHSPHMQSSSDRLMW